MKAVASLFVIFGLAAPVMAAPSQSEAPPPAVSPLTLRFHPADHVYRHAVQPDKGVSDVIAHLAAIVNTGAEAVTLRAARWDLLVGERLLQSVFADDDTLQSAAATMALYDQRGLLKLYDMHFQTGKLLGGAHVSPTPTLEPGAALMLSNQVLLFQGSADRLRLTVEGVTAGGTSVQAEGTLAVIDHVSPNSHRFPMDGTWFVAASADLHDHHRWVTMEEFALDLVQFGEGGRIYRGEPSTVEAHFAYGKPVLATAAGEVVAVEAGQQEATDRLPREGESAEAFAARTQAEQIALLRKNYRAPLGNYVSVRHTGGEFTHYAHLAAGSVTVKPGDRVERGQSIGKVGQTGNSEAPHLHFQVTDGPDPLYSRGLPVVFDNVRVELLGYTDRALHGGWAVTTLE